MKSSGLVPVSLRDGSHARKKQRLSRKTSSSQVRFGVKSCVFVDLDGTLWPDKGPGSLLSALNENFLKEFTSQRFESSFQFIIGISNQTYFARQKMITLRHLFIFKYTLRKLAALFDLDDVFICFHHPHATNKKLRKSCVFRKPNFSLLIQAFDNYDIAKEKSIFIGDRITDMIAANRSGIKNCFLLLNNRSFEFNVGYRDFEDISTYQFKVINSFTDIKIDELQLG